MKSKFRYNFQTIENFVKKYVKDYKILTNGEIAVNSPFVGDTTYDLHINVEKQCWHDWESGEGGNLVKLVEEICHVDEKEASLILLECAGNNKLEIYIPTIKNNNNYTIKEISKPPFSFSFSENNKNLYYKNKAIEFLRKKSVTYIIAKKYNLMWTERSRVFDLNFNYRIIIPTYENSKLVYFQARYYKGETNIPYLNIPATVQPKRYILPFFDLLKPNEPLFISEGCWEAIQYGGTYMLGPVISQEQAVKIRKLNPKDIYLIPDNDETGRRTLINNITMLKSASIKCGVYVIKWWTDEYKDFKDPTDARIKDITIFPIIKADSNINLKIKLGKL
jgi:DNA primase